MKSFRLLLLLAALLAGATAPATAQRYAWAQALQGRDVQATSVSDATGAVYVAGAYRDSLITAAGTIYTSDLGAFNIGAFLAKVSASGTVQWVRALNCDSLGMAVFDLALDGQGHLYLTGHNGYGAHFGAFLLPVEGIFLAQYDTNGTALWARNMRTNATFREYGALRFNLAADAQGNCLLAGRAIFLDSLEGVAIDTTSRGVGLVMKCDANGNTLWVQQIINPLSDWQNPTTYVQNVAVDAAGNCVVVGRFSYVTTFGAAPGAPTLVANTFSGGAFVVKYTPTGAVAWVQGAQGAQGPSIFVDVAIGTADSIYVCGEVGGTLQFPPLTVSQFGMVLFKLDPTGTPLWERHATSTSSSYGTGLCVHPATGDVTVMNQFSRFCQFGTYTVSGSGNSTCVVSYDTRGNVKWAIAPGEPGLTSPSTFTSMPFSISLDAAGSVYLLGGFFGTRSQPTTLPLGPFTLSATNGASIFLIKFSQDVNRLTGQLYLDANANNQRDPTETAFPRSVGVIETNQQQVATADPATGRFTAYADQGAYDLRLPRVPRHYQLMQGSAGHQGNFVGYGRTDTARHFGLTPIPGQPDLRVTLTPFTRARPGMPVRYRLRAENIGTVALPTVPLRVQLDPRVRYIGSQPAPTAQAGLRLDWTALAVTPFQSRDYDITFSVPVTFRIGDTLKTTVLAPIFNAAGQVTGTDTLTIAQVVTGSFDPNDISVNFSTLTAAQIATGEPLDYVVRFQNMGTDTAFAVVIQDTLPAALLQLGTVELISQSHNVTWMLSGPGLMTMRFPGIKLPHRAVDAVRSQGFVRFRIVPRATLTPGTLIPNAAHIFFDFNVPVTTNEVTTLVLTPSGLPRDEASATLSLYPNPADRADRVTLSADIPAAGPVQVLIADALGRTVRRQTLTTPAGAWQHPVSVAGLAPGLYAVRLTLPGGGAVSRRLVVR